MEETGRGPSSPGEGASQGASDDFDDSFLMEVAHAPPPLRTPMLGEWLGGRDGHRFEILEVLGRGAMGRVLRARDDELQREVALKFLLPREGLEEGSLLSLLRREARAIAQLNHENIVRVFDVSEWSGESWEPRIPFLVMECLEGESLAARLQREGRLGVRCALDIMVPVAEGLAHAHEHRVIHRDLKPSNIFLTPRGGVKLLDFGLAWLAVASGPHTPHLPTAGTPPYMAPEQWRGEPQDARTDVWAAGVVLYEMLTGELPYPSATVQELRAKVLAPEPVPSVRERRPEVPEEVAALVAEALAKAPSQRLADAAQLRDRLRRLEEGLGPWREEPRSVAPQRRQVTLVSCKLAVEGGLEEGLDPEDFSELESAFHRSGSEIIQRYGGSITTCVGDELLACFGYPVAQEEDSEHAVRAGQALVDALPGALRRGLGHLALRSLAVRVGIHTELVVFDDIPPELRGRTPTIQGEAPHIASWLARQAGPDTVALSHTTHTLVQRAFESEPLGPHTFEGLGGARRMETWRVVRARKAVFRFDRALASGALSPLVGRERELGELLGHWEAARQGEGSFVLLSGEAGIGKSRLIQELRARVPPESSFRLRCQCWSQFSNSAFSPLIEMLQRLFRLEPEGSPGDNLRALEAQLEAYGLEAEQMGLIAALLSLPVKENLPFLQLSPERQKERTFEALAALLLRMAEVRPVLGVVEDLHWADPSTLELLGYVLERVGASRVLLVLSARPSFHPAWRAHPRLHWQVLERLPAALTATLVQAAGGAALPEETVRQLVARTDGIPLFVEELTRMVLERGAPGAIPVTLHELLLARLDQLPPRQKALAQLCAVVGRGFSRALLVALTRRGPAALRQDLEELVGAGVLQASVEDTEPSYQFRHALLQDAAYQSLLRGTRRQHHRRIAQALVEQFPEVVERQPEVLAHHYTEANEDAQAIRYWTRAGIRASLRSANREAVSHLRQALRLLEGLPDTPGRIREELQLLIALGIPLSQVEGYRSPEVRHTYTRARELFHLMGEELPRLELSFWGPFAYYFARAEYGLAHELAEQLVGLGERQHNRELLSLGCRMVGTDCFTWGRMEEARAWLARALTCSRFSREEHRTLAVRHWVDLRAMALVHDAVVCSAQGEDAQARHRCREALELVRWLAHPHSTAYVLHYTALACQLRGEAQGTLEAAEACIELSAEHGFRLWHVWSSLLRGWALSALGRPEEALGLLRQGLSRWRMSGIRAGMPLNLALLAEVHLRLGHVSEALGALHAGLEWVEAWGERFYEAELHRLRGEALRAQGREAEARESLLRALEVARRQGAHGFERRVRAGLGLAASEPVGDEESRRVT